VVKVGNSDDFFNKGTFLVNEGYETDDMGRYLHDDYKTLQKRVDEFKVKHGNAYGYTLKDGGGRSLIITKGFRVVNRLGYFVTAEDIELENDEIEC